MKKAVVIKHDAKLYVKPAGEDGKSIEFMQIFFQVGGFFGLIGAIVVTQGAIVGERAVVEKGSRTATLRALTACRVVSVPRRYVDERELSEIARGHRREEA